MSASVSVYAVRRTCVYVSESKRVFFYYIVDCIFYPSVVTGDDDEAEITDLFPFPLTLSSNDRFTFIIRIRCMLGTRLVGVN